MMFGNGGAGRGVGVCELVLTNKNTKCDNIIGRDGADSY
jgi:hypothetical protein